ncbi:MAG: hypothetical protein WC679_13605 [Bacteroidales bacterium]|jgi:hypothetical protein
MIKLATNYERAVTAYNHINKGFDGKLTLSQIKNHLKATRTIRDKVLIDQEDAMKLKQKGIMEETSKLSKEKEALSKAETPDTEAMKAIDVKIREINRNFQEEANKMAAEVVTIAMTRECLEALKSSFDIIKIEDLKDKENKQIETGAMLLIGEFMDDIEVALEKNEVYGETQE